MASQELADYVKERRGEGFGDDNIRTVLLNAGYAKNTIEEALNTAPVTSTSLQSQTLRQNIPNMSPQAGSGSGSSQPPTGNAQNSNFGNEPPKIPFGVKFIAVIYYFAAVIGILVGGIGAVIGPSDIGGRITSIAFLVLGLMAFYVMRELLRGRNWARLVLIFGGVGAIASFLIRFLLNIGGLFAAAPAISGFTAAQFSILFVALFISIIPALWSIFIASYLFFSKRVRAVYQDPSAQAGMPGKLIGFLIAGIGIGVFLAILYMFSPPPQTGMSNSTSQNVSSTQQNNPIASATSSAQFTFTSPVGGEQWQQGSTQTISWSGGPNYDNMGLALDITDKTLGADFQYQSISTDPINQKSGSFTWNIPYSIKPGQYKVAACLSNNLGGGSTTVCHTVTSGVISIIAGSTKPTVTLSNFKNGDTLIKGKTYTLTWTTNFSAQGKSVLIAFTKGTLQSQSVDSIISWIRGSANMNDPLPQTDGGISWTVPVSVPDANNYAIMIMVGADSQHPYGVAEQYIYPLTISN